MLLGPRNPGLVSEHILLPEHIPGDYAAASLMVQELPALVVVTIRNEGARPGVCAMLGLLPLGIPRHADWQDWACGHTTARREHSGVYNEGSGCRHSWRSEQPLPTMRQHPCPCQDASGALC
jgi:hypothetical protein